MGARPPGWTNKTMQSTGRWCNITFSISEICKRSSSSNSMVQNNKRSNHLISSIPLRKKNTEARIVQIRGIMWPSWERRSHEKRKSSEQFLQRHEACQATIGWTNLHRPPWTTAPRCPAGSDHVLRSADARHRCQDGGQTTYHVMCTADSFRPIRSRPSTRALATHEVVRSPPV